MTLAEAVGNEGVVDREVDSDLVSVWLLETEAETDPVAVVDRDVVEVTLSVRDTLCVPEVEWEPDRLVVCVWEGDDDKVGDADAVLLNE